LQALGRHGDLRGIYVAGGGMEGAIAALRETRPAGEIALVVSALTPDSRMGLADGTITLVINTPLEKLCAELFQRMIDAVQDGGQAADMGQIFLPPDLHAAESI